MNELVFQVTQEEDGGYCAQAVGHSIFTQGDTWDELKRMVAEAVRLHFEGASAPASIRLHLVRDETLAVA